MLGANEDQLTEFHENPPEFKLEEEHRAWTSEGVDGFYMARMRRNK